MDGKMTSFFDSFQIPVLIAMLRLMQAWLAVLARLIIYFLFAKLVALVYNVFNSFGLGYNKLLKIPLDLYQVLDDPNFN